jgi:hypothetical protein
MQKSFFILSICFSIFISYSFIERKPGCDGDHLFQQALGKLSGYSYLKDYRIYLKEKQKSASVEMVYFPFTLNRGVKYKFLSMQNAKLEGQLTISLYSVRNDKPDFLFATNYKKDLNKIYESIEFQVDNTMNVMIGFAFKDGKEGCGVGMSSFLRD